MNMALIVSHGRFLHYGGTLTVAENSVIGRRLLCQSTRKATHTVAEIVIPHAL